MGSNKKYRDLYVPSCRVLLYSALWSGDWQFGTGSSAGFNLMKRDYTHKLFRSIGIIGTFIRMLANGKQCNHACMRLRLRERVMSEERMWRRGRRSLLVACRPAGVSVGGGGEATTAASIQPADPFATGETTEGVALVWSWLAWHVVDRHGGGETNRRRWIYGSKG